VGGRAPSSRLTLHYAERAAAGGVTRSKACAFVHRAAIRPQAEFTFTSASHSHRVGRKAVGKCPPDCRGGAAAGDGLLIVTRRPHPTIVRKLIMAFGQATTLACAVVTQ
jgi:hypothetical protein